MQPQPVPRPSGNVSVAYYVNWAIYARKHFPWELPFQHLTHVLYSFANVRPESGEVYLTDGWSDEQIHWPDRGDSWNDTGNNVYGCFNQFRQLKYEHRHLKLILSIGGWTYSSNFAPATDSEAKRQAFADSCKALVEDYGLDGIDVDWEYPKSDDEAQRFVDLLRRTRLALDDLAKSKGERQGYLLTIATPCGQEHYSKLRVKEMDQYLSFWNLMAYDYAGSWDTLTGHQANLWPNVPSPNQGNFSTDAAVQFYSCHVHPSKLIMGMPLYGRSFASTQSQPGSSFSGVGQGSWEPGVYDYKVLPQPDTQVSEDLKLATAFTFNSSTLEFVSFDTPSVVCVKADYIKRKQLGGVMWWESSGDKDESSNQSLISIVANKLGGLDQSKNHVWFPDSKWDNVKSHPKDCDEGPPPTVPLGTKPLGDSPWTKD